MVSSVNAPLVNIDVDCVNPSPVQDRVKVGLKPVNTDSSKARGASDTRDAMKAPPPEPLMQNIALPKESVLTKLMNIFGEHPALQTAMWGAVAGAGAGGFIGTIGGGGIFSPIGMVAGIFVGAGIGGLLGLIMHSSIQGVRDASGESTGTFFQQISHDPSYEVAPKLPKTNVQLAANA